MGRSRTRTCLAVALTAFATAVTLATPAAAQDGPAAVALELLPGGTNSSAFAVNDRGTIVGRADAADGRTHPARWSTDGVTALELPPDAQGGTASHVNELDMAAGNLTIDWEYRAARWDSNGVLTDLGVLPGMTSSYVLDMNNRGVVVGVSHRDQNPSRPVLWTPTGRIVELKLLPGGIRGSAKAINDDGTIVGEVYLSGSGPRAVRWSPHGAVTDLGALPGGDTSHATAINEQGAMLGTARTAPPDYTYHPVRWSRSGAITRLDPHARFTSVNAQVINDRGAVAGVADGRTVRWSPTGEVVELPLPAGEYGGSFVDMNDLDTVVGSSFYGTGSGHALLWDATGALTVLGNLPGSTHSVAEAVNDRGTVVGSAEFGINEAWRAVRWY